MLGVVVLLIAVSCCSGADPILWGSRVVGTPKGPSPPMYFRVSKGSTVEVVLKGGKKSKIDFRNGKCYVGGEVWGQPCEINDESANITLNDVLRQDALKIVLWDSVIATVFFAPNCTFPRPKEGEVDLRKSFPLSLFRRGYSYVEVTFAVGGANSQTPVRFYVDDSFACRWEGHTLRSNGSYICSNLVQDQQADLRIFTANYTRENAAAYTRFEWAVRNTSLILTVDWLQGGESPEVAECKALVTSLGSVVVCPLTIVLAGLLMPMLL